MDTWNPETFDIGLRRVLTKHSGLIRDFYAEERRLMDEHLNSDPYQSHKPNKHSAKFSTFLEGTVTPLLGERRIRVWHYTRLLDCEILSMQRKLEPSTLASLRKRLDAIESMGLLTPSEAQIVYTQSPFHKQNGSRSNRLCTTTVPFSPDYDGVKPFLESWGGESVYFWQTDEIIVEKLKCIGTPRVVEIETALSDDLNAYSTSNTVTEAWARRIGAPVKVQGCDLTIKSCLESAFVLRVHTAGDGVFEKIATTYPCGSGKLLAE